MYTCDYERESGRKSFFAGITLAGGGFAGLYHSTHLEEKAEEQTVENLVAQGISHPTDNEVATAQETIAAYQENLNKAFSNRDYLQVAHLTTAGTTEPISNAFRLVGQANSFTELVDEQSPGYEDYQVASGLVALIGTLGIIVGKDLRRNSSNQSPVKKSQPASA